MTMSGSRRNVPAGEFKAHCLGLLDQVARTGEILIVTKRGRPVAKICPLEQSEPGSLRNSVKYHEDIMEPLEEKWDADS
jgi:prevent-host-death family protein